MLVFVLELILFLLVVLCAIRTYFSDCDAFLNFYEVFGPKREKILRGKVAWITGASSGIGEYLSYELARCGCKLVLSARRKDELARVKNRCVELAQECYSQAECEYEKDFFVLPLDLTKYSTHSDLVSSVLQEFGKIDILINNAGILQMGDAIKTWLECDQLVMGVNVLGTISLTKALLPHMVKRNTGQIVVISSAGGKSGVPGFCTYAASKHALQGYFNTLRMEVHKSNVGVTLVCPGLVYSNIFKTALYENPQTCRNAEFPPTTIQTKRCAHLITVAMANRLDEVWIAIPSRLAALYLQQYLPLVFNKWARWKYRRTKKFTDT